MFNVFVLLLDDFLVRDETATRAELDAGETDWFRKKGAEAFNEPHVAELDDNLFSSTANVPEEAQQLDPSYREGFIVTATKRKSEFNDIRF